MRFFSNFLKRIKDKIGFRIMTKEEYELFLRKKRMGHKSSSFNTNLSMSSVNSNNSSSIHNEINPATGLPTSNGIDVGGNPYGVDLSSSFDSINPATGQISYGGVDVLGNPYGSDINNSIDNTYQSFENSFNNDFHNH